MKLLFGRKCFGNSVLSILLSSIKNNVFAQGLCIYGCKLLRLALILATRRSRLRSIIERHMVICPGSFCNRNAIGNVEIDHDKHDDSYGMLNY